MQLLSIKGIRQKGLVVELFLCGLIYFLLFLGRIFTLNFRSVLVKCLVVAVLCYKSLLYRIDNFTIIYDIDVSKISLLKL